MTNLLFKELRAQLNTSYMQSINCRCRGDAISLIGKLQAVTYWEKSVCVCVCVRPWQVEAQVGEAESIPWSSDIRPAGTTTTTTTTRRVWLKHTGDQIIQTIWGPQRDCKQRRTLGESSLLASISIVVVTSW